MSFGFYLKTLKSDHPVENRQQGRVRGAIKRMMAVDCSALNHPACSAEPRFLRCKTTAIVFSFLKQLATAVSLLFFFSQVPRWWPRGGEMLLPG